MAKKETAKDIMNRTMANSGTPFATKANKEIAKKDAKQARNDVIKSAVVGGIIAGKTGSIVGAVAAKSKANETNKNK